MMNNKNYRKQSFARQTLLWSAFVLIISLTLSSCNGASESTGTLEGWDYFESFNPIGTIYEEIEHQYDSLEEDGVYDGGVALKVDDSDLYFGFPAQSKDEISPDDKCSTVYGTLRTVFGISDDCTVNDLSELLNVSFKEDYEESLIGTASVASGSYYVQLYTASLEDELTPDSGVALFYNEDNRQGVGEVPDESIYIDLYPVDSSAISSIGYDYENSILAIEFRETQELWYYYGVPEDIYLNLQNADSIGKYYNEYIKGNYKSIEQN